MAATSLGHVAQSPAAPGATDGRAFELLSGGLESGRDVKQAPPVVDPTGDRAIFETTLAQADSGAARERIFRLGSRTGSGWTSVDINPASARPASADQYKATSPTADRFLIDANGLRADDTGVNRTYAVDTATRVATRVSEGEFAGASRSTRVVYFASQDNLTPGAQDLPSETVKIYRTDANGTTSLASAVPPEYLGSDGYSTPIEPLAEGYAASTFGFRNLFFDTAADVNSQTDSTPLPVAGGRRHVFSEDGSTLFFRARTKDILVPNPFDPSGAGVPPSGANGAQLLTLWRSDLQSGATPISASRRTGENNETRVAQFIGASPDGGVAYFVTGVPLKDGETGGGVYRYAHATGELTRLTPDVPDGTDQVNGLEQLGVSSAWTSDDGSTVYFVSTSKLTGEAVAGARNGFVWRDGSLRFVADVGPDGRVERVSRDGAFAVFSETLPTGSGPDRVQQLFRYERATGTMLCASCRSDGTPNTGPATLRYTPGGMAPADRLTDLTTPRNVSDDGSVFFVSQDRLVPEDQSARPDVYEFTGNEVRLLSNGEGTSTLVDNTDDGRSVFMTSTAALVPSDDDAGNFDLYVRRLGGGFPTAPAATPPCRGDGCQGVSATPPAPTLPGSDRVGAGNVRPTARPVILSAPRLTSASRRALARGARGTVQTRLQGPGQLTIKVVGRVRGERRTVASTSTRIASDQAQNKRTMVRLSRAARRKLRRRGLNITVTAALSGAESRSTVVKLRKGR